MSGAAQVKNKIKQADRLLGNAARHSDITKIFYNITSILTQYLPWSVITVYWSGYPAQQFHLLRASLICGGRSIPLMSHHIPSYQQ